MTGVSREYSEQGEEGKRQERSGPAKQRLGGAAPRVSPSRPCIDPAASTPLAPVRPSSIPLPQVHSPSVHRLTTTTRVSLSLLEALNRLVAAVCCATSSLPRLRRRQSRGRRRADTAIAATQPVTHHLAHLRCSWLPHPKSVHWLAIHARAGRDHPVFCHCDAGRSATKLGRRKPQRLTMAAIRV